MVVYQNFNSSVPYNLDVREYNDFNHISHLHRDFELIYVEGGELNVSIENEELSIKEGNAVLVLQNEIHSFSTKIHSRIWVAVFSEDYVRDFAQEIEQRRVNSHLIELSVSERNFLLENLIFGDRERFIVSACLAYACGLFLRRCTEKCASVPKNAVKNDLIHGILTYLNAHYKENIRLSDISVELGYEEHYVSRIFNKFFGKSLTSFVNEYRIYYARTLMRNEPKLTLAQIAFASGFGSLRNFNRAYLSIVGEAPKRNAKINKM